MSGDAAEHRTVAPGVVGQVPTPAPFTVTMAATARNARTMRHDFQDWITQVLPSAAAVDLTLAVYEALANAVDHAFVDHHDVGTMSLTATVSEKHVEVAVTDDGTWRDPTDALRGRGRGIRLMHYLVSSARISLGSTGTLVRLRQRIPPR